MDTCPPNKLTATAIQKRFPLHSTYFASPIGPISVFFLQPLEARGTPGRIRFETVERETKQWESSQHSAGKRAVPTKMALARTDKDQAADGEKPPMPVSSYNELDASEFPLLLKNFHQRMFYSIISVGVACWWGSGPSGTSDNHQGR